MSIDLRLASILAGSALAFAAPVLMPSAAQACGGTFCDAGPTAMPVDQTGENVLFHIGANSVEAHIQIQVDPNAEADQFAWLLPLTAVPEFSVGSQLLFDNILAASVPRYGITNNFDFCGGMSEEGGGEANDTGGDPTGDGDGDGGPGPSVVFQDTVGAFEIVVLEGGTVASIMQWLGDNGYQQDPVAEPILAEYLAEGFVFAAFKLAVESGVEDVHPIVIRYDGVEPCVPIRLTRIAAEDDMDIRVFFLGDGRVVPTNYRHVLVNPLKIDWFNNAANYKEVITMAVDAEHAAGNAFVTEYAGPSNIISLAGVFNAAWNPAPFADLGGSPVGLYELLTSQSLMFCDLDWDNTCTTLHPLLQPLLNQYVPVPVGVEPVDFYTCMSCYEDQIDLTAWNALAFAEALDERIFKPGQLAADLVNAHPYLTRMYTTISPHEMNADPMFRTNPTLPEVGTTRWADQTLHCDGSTTVELPDGRQIYFPPGEQLIWPEFQDAMPWEEAVDQEGMAENAPLINLSDNTDQINELLDEWNKGRGQGSDTGETGGDAGIDGDSGCGCTTEAGSAGNVALGFGLLGLLGLVRRRRLG